MSHRNKEYDVLLHDQNVRRWNTNAAKGSVILADVYLRSLGRFCRAIDSTPAKFIGLSQNEMEDTAQDYIDKLESLTNPKNGKPYSPSYVENCLTAIRSWASWNRKPFLRAIKIKDANSTPTLEDERALSPDELQRLLYSDSTPLRTRASIALVVFSGCRPEVQGDHVGTDGLRLKDLPEIEISDGKVEFKNVPTMVVVRKNLSKIRKQYPTLLFEEGCIILKEYLERRINEGEKLTKDSGVIISSPEQSRRANWAFGEKDSSPFLRTPKISANIREAMRKVGIPFRPYVLRVSFDTALLTAEGKGMISHAYQQFVMGHAGDIERTYTLSKCSLPEEVVEDIRSACRRASQFIQTTRIRADDRSLIKEMREGFLLGKGATPEQLATYDLEGMSNEEFFKLLSSINQDEPEVNPQSDNPHSTSKSAIGRHQCVPLAQLKDFLASGCKYVDKYTDENGKPMAIVEMAFR